MFFERDHFSITHLIIVIINRLVIFFQLIDEFTDVNEGEKEVMKMWNLHIMHYK